jgi:hypothetical protein
MSLLAPLAPLRAHAGTRLTDGLDDATVQRLAATHPHSARPSRPPPPEYARIKDDFAGLLDRDEAEQVHAMQVGFVNFYPADCVQPYVALTARGPWIVTLKGAVLHDAGGYGMLGAGHAGHRAGRAGQAAGDGQHHDAQPVAVPLRPGAARRDRPQPRRGCPYAKFMCLNSGSKPPAWPGVSPTSTASCMTEPGAPHAGRTIKRVVVKGSFHGRTEPAARFSDSSRKDYQKHLASYRNDDSLIAIPPYDVAALERAFADAETQGWHIEAVFLEPVMGEGDPGRSVPVAFAAARRLSREHGSLFLVDSIQAGLRAQACCPSSTTPASKARKRRTWRPTPRRSTPRSSRCRCSPWASVPPPCIAPASTATP